MGNKNIAFQVVLHGHHRNTFCTPLCMVKACVVHLGPGRMVALLMLEQFVDAFVRTWHGTWIGPQWALWH